MIISPNDFITAQPDWTTLNAEITALQTGLAAVPAIATAAPKSEATQAAAGTISSRHLVTLDANGRAPVVFVRAFDVKPVFFLEEEDDENAQPVSLKIVKGSWVVDAQGRYTGCVVKGMRAQTLPANITLLTGLVNFNTFGASAAGVVVACIFLPPSPPAT